MIVKFGRTPFKGKNRDDTFAQILKCGLKLPDFPVVCCLYSEFYLVIYLKKNTQGF